MESISRFSRPLLIIILILYKHNKVKDSEGNNIDLTDKLFNTIAPRYATRVGGYTQIIKKGQRRGDAAETVILKLV